MQGPESILTSSAFWQVFKDSGSINESRGMTLHELASGNAKLHLFSKTHSYGEYIFDWSWAQAYQENGLPYYPKLNSMVPFTPATARHFLGPESHWPDLLRQHDELMKGHSSSHFLFTTPEENQFLGQRDFMIRDSFQYHFVNEGYENFDHFLSHLKSRKAKNIRHERNFPDLIISQFTGATLTVLHAAEMYQFYLSTIGEKRAIPYLTDKFFHLLFERLPDNVLFVKAEKDGLPVAGALFYYDSERIYGRYWGSHSYVPNLHFELCYYQGIEFCIDRNLSVFEAGAQGEHKIARGFRPVLTTSAHRIVHSGFRKAVSDYIRMEKEDVALTITELSKLLPFK